MKYTFRKRLKRWPFTLIVALGFVISTQCDAQIYYCPVANGVKLDQWFSISDSLVKTKTVFKGKTDSLSFVRVKSTNPTEFYYTNGITTSSLYPFETKGTIKGYSYTYILSLVPDIKSPNVKGTFHCTIISR